MSPAGLLLAAAVLAAPGGQDCARLEAAHEVLLGSSFTVVRHFTVSLNDALKVREMTRLAYDGGELSRETLEREVFDDNVVLEEGEDETALAVPFACERLEELEAGRYVLSSADETERVTFEWSEERGALRPLSWENQESKRLLFKRFVIEAVAEYRDFEWR